MNITTQTVEDLSKRIITIQDIKKIQKRARFARWFEGVTCLGYYEEGDSFLIKHPNENAFWLVSKTFVNNLNK